MVTVPFLFSFLFSFKIEKLTETKEVKPIYTKDKEKNKYEN